MTGLLVVVPIEGQPMLVVDALNDAQEARLRDWLRSSFVLTHLAADLMKLQADLICGEDEPEAA